MDYYFHVFYTIKPRPELAGWLAARVASDVVETLTKPTVYYAEEKEDSSWLESDRLLKAKLVFLHALRHYHQCPLPSETEFLAAFGTTTISAALFDQWFTIERQQTWQELGGAQELLAYSTEPAAPTGSTRVDEWLANLRDWKGKPVIIGSVLFHSPGELQISPLVHGSWQRPVLSLLEEAGAAGGFGNSVDDACAGFIAWCLSKNPRPANVSISNLPGTPSRDADSDPFEWYDRVMAMIATWEKPPFLVDLDEFSISLNGETLWPPNKRGRERPKDPRTMRPGSPFVWGWYGQSLGDYRPGKGTYTCFPYESLPPIPVTLNGHFQWLKSARDADRVIGNVRAIESGLSRLLAEDPPGLPSEFVTFFRSPALWRKVRSCTDCYFDIDPASTPIPGGLGRLVRFMSDSQGCIHWHLCISPCGTTHTVVATYHFTGSEYAHKPSGKPHPRDVTTCAASFEEFIYRFWIENELWYALSLHQAMPEHGEEYLAHYRRV
jgi:hypothetical protein